MNQRSFIVDALKEKKGITGGIIQGLVFGVVSLIIGIIIGLIVVVTLIDANLFGTTQTVSITVNNETPSWVNSSNYTLASVNSSTSGYVIINIWNLTSPDLVPSGYYQLTADGVIFTNGTDYPHETNTTYSFVHNGPANRETNTVANLSANLSAGIDQISLKLITVFTVAAIVLILAVLVILVAVWQRMRLSDGGGI